MVKIDHLKDIGKGFFEMKGWYDAPEKKYSFKFTEISMKILYNRYFATVHALSLIWLEHLQKCLIRNETPVSQLQIEAIVKTYQTPNASIVFILEKLANEADKVERITPIAYIEMKRCVKALRELSELLRKAELKKIEFQMKQSA